MGVRMRGQSAEAQADRLARGCCPVHGIGMSQVGGPVYPQDGSLDFVIVGCDRRDCDIRAKAFSSHGPWELIGADWTPPEERNPYFDRARNEVVAVLTHLDQLLKPKIDPDNVELNKLVVQLRSRLESAFEELR